MRESLAEYKWRAREREKICFAFYAVCSFSCACEIFSIFPFLVFQKLARVALGHSNLKTAVSFRPKKTQKWTLFHASKRGQEESSKFLRWARVFALVLGDIKRKAQNTRKKMNVSSTHAVALHGMNNARGSQRTTSASTSSLIARKNTRSYNTKKNINTARHHQQRSIIRYARQ